MATNSIIPITAPGTAPTPKRGTSDWYRQLHPFAPMDPYAPPNPVSWLVPGILMEHKINFMFGPEKAGKSRFLRYVLANMFYGGRLFEEQACRPPRRILYLAGEEQPNDFTHGLMSSVRALGFDPDAVPWADHFTLVQAAGMRLDKADVRAWMKQEVIGGGYDTVMIDPLRRVHAASESSNDEMAYLSNAFRDWSNSLGITILIIHHTGKFDEETTDMSRIANWSRGASDIASVLDWATFITRAGTRVTIQRDGRAAPRPTLVLEDRGEGKKWSMVKGHV